VLLEATEAQELMNVLPDVLRDEYLRLVQTHIDTIRQGAMRCRVDYELLKTTEPLDAALFSYLSRRSEFG
jgi:hypothetical protein